MDIVICAHFLSQLCSRYCVVCHKGIGNDFEALKPYVCNSGLCAYQYYSLNFGPSLEVSDLYFSNPCGLSLINYPV